MSTDIEATFLEILSKAKENNVPESEMPTMVLILSDMEFDEANGSRYSDTSTWNPTAQTMIEENYTEAGYKVPKIVY